LLHHKHTQRWQRKKSISQSTSAGGSGRVLAGEFDGKRIELHELNRFENRPSELPEGKHWNITDIYLNILDGLKVAAQKYGRLPISLGIDTWGVDYALLDKDGHILGLPFQYRDNRTEGHDGKSLQHGC
jgi:rhamnulokinase